MRILIASDLHWPTINGIATFGRNLAQGLAERGHEVVVVAPSQTGKKYEEKDQNHRVVRTASVVFPFYQNLRVSLSPNREINEITKHFKPDIIHLQTPLGIGLGAIAAAKKYHVPLVATNHSMSENLIDNLKLLAPFARQIDYILREYGSRFYGNADYVTLPTVAAIRMLKPDSFAKPYVAISNGIDLKRFHPGRVTPEFYDKYNIPMNVPIVMYLGRLDSEKHVSILLRALQHLDPKLPYHAVVVGDGNDLDHLMEVATDLGLEDRVTFVGRIDEADKPMILRLGTIFTMPSPAELQSISTMEAMASGMPVVAVNAGALYELVKPEENGFLFDIDDYEMMSSGIGELLADPARVKSMSARSKEIVSKHDMSVTLDKFEELYAEVIAMRAPAKPELSKVN
jgi:glycosyltransferase involved in cell wall biosynthesis